MFRISNSATSTKQNIKLTEIVWQAYMEKIPKKKQLKAKTVNFTILKYIVSVVCEKKVAEKKVASNIVVDQLSFESVYIQTSFSLMISFVLGAGRTVDIVVIRIIIVFC